MELVVAYKAIRFLYASLHSKPGFIKEKPPVATERFFFIDIFL
jgi:hypothetical protein